MKIFITKIPTSVFIFILYVFGQNAFFAGSTNLVINQIAGSSTTAQSEDGLRFYPSTGNFVNGFIKLYGIS